MKLRVPKIRLTASLAIAYLVAIPYQPAPKASKPDARRELEAFAATTPRKIYRYSIVPGGVFSPEELAAARRSDPVVAAHFADFGKNTWLTTLPEDVFVHVSYRKGSQVYYTKKKHKVCKGEVVITDGKNYARTRCANRITKIFRPPAQVYDEPRAPQFDYIEPPEEPAGIPVEPLLTTNYYGLPDGPAFNVLPQPQSGANPGPPSPSGAFGPALAVLPQMQPFAAGSPALLTPLATTPGGGGGTPGGGGGSPGGGGGTPGGGGGGTAVPEPYTWPFVLGGFATLLTFYARRHPKNLI